MSTTTTADRQAIGDQWREAGRSALGAQIEIGRAIEALLDKAGEVARKSAADNCGDKARADARAAQRKLLVTEEGMPMPRIVEARRFAACVAVCGGFSALTRRAAQALAPLAVLDRATDSYSVPETEKQPWREMLTQAVVEVSQERNQGDKAAELGKLIRDPDGGASETSTPDQQEPADTPQAQSSGNGEATAPTPQAQPGDNGDPDLDDQGEEQEADEELPDSYDKLPALGAARTVAEIMRISQDRPAAYRGLGQIIEGDDIAQVVRGYADWLESEHIADATPRWHALVRQIAEQGARLTANHVIERVERPQQVA